MTSVAEDESAADIFCPSFSKAFDAVSRKILTKKPMEVWAG